MHDFIVDWNQEVGEKIFEVVGVRGKAWIGVDPSHVNKFFDGPRSPYPKRDLVGKQLKAKVAGSKLLIF